MAITVRPGGRVALKFHLNQNDAISVTVDWSSWLGADTISSVTWTDSSGLVASSESNTTTAASALLTAGTTNGRHRVECQITTAAGQKRSIAIDGTVVDLL